MSYLAGNLPREMLLFGLVVARVAGLMFTVPVFGSKQIPVAIRSLLALGIALVIAPLALRADLPQSASALTVAILLASEILLGVGLGLGVVLLLSAMQLAGQIIGQMSGVQLAESLDPAFESPSPVFSQMLLALALAIFLIVGGHRMLMAAMLDSFAAIPPGSAVVSASMLEMLVTLLTHSFSLGVRVAVPSLVALLLATLVMALISRSTAQLNFTTVGFGINSLVMYAALTLSMGAMAWTFSSQIDPVLEQIADVARNQG